MKKYIHLFLASFLALIIGTISAQTPTWTLTGPNLFPVKTIGQVHGIGRISQLKFHPTDANKMYCTSATGGLWYSSNKGVSWSVMGTDKYNRASASIAIDPTNDQIIYWGTGDANYYGPDAGVYKSTDGGQTFTVSNNGMGNRLVIDILLLPTDHNTLIAATDGGIYKSTDAGANWSLKSANDDFNDICFQIGSNGQTVYAASYKGYYRSLNAGNTWTKINSVFTFGGNGTRVAVTAADANVVYVVNVGASDVSEVYRSTDGGATFTAKRTELTKKLSGYDASSTGQGNYNFDIEASPTNANELYICAHIIWRSTDGGATWTQQQNSWAYDLHTDQHQLIFDPYVAGKLWNVNDGGVFSNTTNGTGAWTNNSDGLACTEIYRAATSNISADYAYIGTQDNGGFYYKTGTWYNDRGGDWGPEEFFDYLGNNVYDDEQGSRKNIGVGTKNLNLPFTSGNTNKAKFAFTPANTAIGYCTASGVVYRCSNLSATTLTWTQIYSLPTGTVEDMEVDPGNADVLYIINSASNVYRSDNATTTATFTTLTLPQSTSGNGFIAPIKSSNVVYAAAYNKIYRSGDKGLNWTLTTGFPSAVVKGLVHDRFSPTEAMYACYNLGVYYNDNTLNNWTNYSQGLPIISDITDLMLYNNAQNQGLLRVSYYGRGMWESPLVSTYQNITVTLTSPTNGATFTDPATINLAATASVVTGNITKVEFYNGNTLLATVTNAPYTFTWSNVPFGTYAITAKAYDNTNATKTSTVANITVNLVCSKLTGTAFGTSPAYSVGSEFDKASDGNINTFFDCNAGNGGYTGLDLATAKKVNAIRFYPRAGQEGRMDGGKFQGSNVSNFSSGVTDLYVISGSPASGWNEVASLSSSTFRYVRYLSPNNGYCNIAEMEFCGVSNLSPTVTLTAPANHALYPTVPATVNLTATAADADGTITKVEFYQGNTLVGTSNASPFVYSWINVAAGTYYLSAKAYDNLGATGTSNIDTIIVGNQSPVVTITSPSNNAMFSQPANITINATASDPDGTISKVEFYNGNTLLGTDNNAAYSFVWNGVTAGNYQITAKAYDNSTGVATSSVINVTVGNQNPTVFITTPANNSSYTGPATINLAALASDPDGTITKVEFYNGGTLIGTGNSGNPFTFSWTNVAVGNYTITAKAYDNLNGTTTSSAITVTVSTSCAGAAWNSSSIYTIGMQASYNGHMYTANWWSQNNQPDQNIGQWTDNGACAAGNQSPVVSITSPLDNATFGAPASITIDANATDGDGTIASVKFYNGTTLLNTDNGTPFTFNWSNVANGTYQIVAVATDNSGTSTTSTAITVIVQEIDCYNVVGGTAFLDSCGTCAGGTTGVTPILSTGACTTKALEISKNNINVYPNPNVGIFTINLKDLEGTNAMIKIYSMDGKLVYEKNCALSNSSSLESIDISTVSSGIYIVNVTADNFNGSQRISIQEGIRPRNKVSKK
jgi:photosystem II stability/assembly factor-like uncharacterized protein